MTERIYATKRMSIVTALADKMLEIDGTGDFLTNVNNNVSSRLLFMDEITDYPAIHVHAGSEYREYQGAGVRDRYLTVLIRAYVNEEDAVLALDALIEDIETVVETNSKLEYTDKQGNTQYTHQISIVTIDTDEGVLEPLGAAEITLEVRY